MTHRAHRSENHDAYNNAERIHEHLSGRLLGLRDALDPAHLPSGGEMVLGAQSAPQ